MIHEVPETAYLDRMRRMLEARGVIGGKVDVDAIRRILAEVPPIELLPGTRYRIVTFGGKSEARHVHGIGTDRETGEPRLVAFDIADVPRPEWLELDVTYRERLGTNVGPLSNLLLFDIDGQDGKAALADMDLLRVTKIES